MKPPRLHPEARAEMLAALEWYDQIDPMLALDLRARLDSAYQRIAKHPLQFPPYLLGTRRCLLRRFPFALVFDMEPEILVLALAHQQQHPGYWIDRKEQ